MNTQYTCPHDHDFLSARQQKHEKRTYFVLFLTLATMAAEIVSGLVFGSMALLADGWHMAGHASAMGITALAYYLSRKHRNNKHFTFGTGKIGDLGGFSSALFLGMVSLFMVYESVHRLIDPVAIRYNEALLVAVVGLVVNVVSAFALKEDHAHDHEHHEHDLNLRAAYLHVMADALTSITAIIALVFAKYKGWMFLDPLMGIVGAVVISVWAYNLIRDTGRVLLDYNKDCGVTSGIMHVLDTHQYGSLDDLHVWRLGPGHYSAVLSLRTHKDITPDSVKNELSHIPHLSHITVEINKEA